MKTLDDVKSMIRELDPYLDESDPFFEAAVIMLSALGRRRRAGHYPVQRDPPRAN